MLKKVFALFMVLALIAAMGCVSAAALASSSDVAADNGAADSRAEADGRLSRQDMKVGRFRPEPVVMEASPAPATGASASDPESVIKDLVFNENSDTVTGPEEVTLNEFTELSNGTYLFQYTLAGVTYSDVAQLESIGGYTVTHGEGTPFYIYTTDGEIVELKDAYEQGVINDDIMDELVESSVFFEAANPSDDPDDPEATEADEEDIDEPEAPATGGASTPDQSTPDQIGGKSDSGPAVQTGAVFSGIVFLLMAECIAVAIIYRRKMNNIK